jgi:glucokinase
MDSILVADIGGTHFNAGIFSRASAQIAYARKLKVAEFANLQAAIKSYWELVLAQTPSAAFPSQAAFAVATPIVDDQVHFTNSRWSFSISQVQAELGLAQLHVLNDFEALALSLPHLSPKQLRCHAGAPNPNQIMAVIGPGTGLGVGGVCPTQFETSAGHGSPTAIAWRALAGEGGHATLAAGNDFEADILQVVRQQFDHVSAERLLSGMGLPTLYAAIAQVMGRHVAAATTPDIIAHGLAGTDVVAAKTLAVFCGLLGSFAGNVALTLGARGGLMIGGGIIPRLGDYFFASEFRARFEAKGRFAQYMRAIPTALIIDPQAALAGAARAIV